MVTVIWDQLLSIIGQEAGSRVVETWFKAISLLHWDSVAKIVYLQTPNAFVKEWVQNNYTSLLEVHLGRLLHVHELKINFVVKGIPVEGDVVTPATVAHGSIKPAYSTTIEMPAVPSHLPKRPAHINSKYLFDTFVVGPNNSLAYAAANAITQKPGQLYNPLFIYGDSGLGKTHLLHAIGNAIKQQHGEAVLLYQTADRFVSEFIHAIRFDKIHKFQAKYQNVDVLLIDDIQFISNKEQTQEAFFHIFNALYDAHKQIVFSSDTFPQNINGIAERLRSRLGWGLVTDIHAPTLEIKIAIIKKKAEMSAEPIDDEVAYYIASQVFSNVRELEGALIRVLAYALLIKQPLTKELAQKVLAHTTIHVSPKKIIDFPTIVHAVRRHYPYELQELCSKNRHKEITQARHVAMYLMKKLTNKSLRDIGFYLGNRDHATVKHGIEKMQTVIKTDKMMQSMVKQIEQHLIDK